MRWLTILVTNGEIRAELDLLTSNSWLSRGSWRLCTCYCPTALIACFTRAYVLALAIGEVNLAGGNHIFCDDLEEHVSVC